LPSKPLAGHLERRKRALTSLESRYDKVAAQFKEAERKLHEKYDPLMVVMTQAILQEKKEIAELEERLKA
jgi:flagellar capping protein FliD